MQTLLILRHAKSSWKDVGQTDHDRPLNKRGQRDAPRVGELLVRENLTPAQIFASSAVRARTTAEMVAEHCGFPLDDLDVTSQLYLAAPDTYIDYLKYHASAAGPVMVVGHNPGMESLVQLLTGVAEHFPTAALAQVELDVDQWSQLSLNASGRLVHLWRPKDEDAD